jgi:hypothetical protein
MMVPLPPKVGFCNAQFKTLVYQQSQALVAAAAAAA